MKRSLSESDSEDSEILDVEDTGAFITEGGEASARKKRRGLIEKRRRDRINSCLVELRRLVPAAVEKQGSAKLEKAEILQLTVEYLKTLKQVKDFGGVLPVSSAAECRAAGFHRCMAEVTRYLNASETTDSQAAGSPIKAQLLQHINWYSTQSPLSPPNAQTSQTVSLPPVAQLQNDGPPVHSTQGRLTPDCLTTSQGVINHNNTLESGQKQDETESDRFRAQGVLCAPAPNVLPRFPMLAFNPPNLFPIARSDMNFPLPFPGQLTEFPFALLATSSTNPTTPFFPPWTTRLFSSPTSSIAF